MFKFDDLYADFPDAARTLLKRYYGYWRIAPIEDLLTRPGRHYIAAIPRDLRRLIAQHVQDRDTVHRKEQSAPTGLYYTVCNMLHRLDPGPAIESKNLTCYCKYGVLHRTDGVATLRKAEDYVYRFWCKYGEPYREYNMPTRIAKQYAADDTLVYCFAHWPAECGQRKDEYITNGEHVKLFHGGHQTFVVTTDLTTGVCEFIIETAVSCCKKATLPKLVFFSSAVPERRPCIIWQQSRMPIIITMAAKNSPGAVSAKPASTPTHQSVIA